MLFIQKLYSILYKETGILPQNYILYYLFKKKLYYLFEKV